jgi:hypothetical protein
MSETLEFQRLQIEALQNKLKEANETIKKMTLHIKVNNPIFLKPIAQ